jgi:hypothetical protein
MTPGMCCISDTCPDNDIAAAGKYIEPMFWELQLKGFKEGTSETDHLLIWVKVGSRGELDSALDTVSKYVQDYAIIEDDLKGGELDYEDGIDAKLPEDTEKLKTMILEKVKEM